MIKHHKVSCSKSHVADLHILLTLQLDSHAEKVGIGDAGLQHLLVGVLHRVVLLPLHVPRHLLVRHILPVHRLRNRQQLPISNGNESRIGRQKHQ